MLLSAIREQNKSDEIYVCSLFGNDILLAEFRQSCREVFCFDFRTKFNPCVIFKLYRFIKKIKPDIVHTHLFFASFYGQIAAQLSNTPALCTEHNVSNWQRRQWLVKRGLAIYCRLTHHIIAVSSVVKNAMIETGIPEFKISVLHNAINIKSFLCDRNDNNAEKRKLIIGTVGRLDYRKGIDVLLRAIALLQKQHAIKCIIIGDGPEKDNLKRLSQQLKIENDVDFKGAQTNIRPYLQQMDIFVLPSRSEGFGVALLEAMAAKLPVVGADTGGITEIISHKENGLLFETENEADLAEKIGYLLENNSGSQKMIDNAFQFISNQFSIDNYTENLKKRYLQILSNTTLAD